MKFQYNDGGRTAAGYTGNAGDCVCRSIAIASGRPYSEVYDLLAQGMGTQRLSKHVKTRSATARNGIWVKRKWFKELMVKLGFKWTPTMTIGSGCKVHLHDGELPSGRLVVAVSKHYTAVIDGVVNDRHDPQRDVHVVEPDRGQPLRPGQWRLSNGNGLASVQRRCVYGYWTFVGGAA